MREVLCNIHTAVEDSARLTSLVYPALPDGDYKSILIKPNWVHHEVDPRFPISAMVTSADILKATINACLEKYRGVKNITVADSPLQTCDLELLMAQAGIAKVRERYVGYKQPLIRFLDLRRQRYIAKNGFLVKDTQGSFGDPLGYSEVLLDNTSMLDPISRQSDKFRVSDYSPEYMTVGHKPNSHKYLIANSVLASELFINLPKMKTHQKAGITGALKNLVGINGEKAFLVHYRLGNSREHGDEFPPATPLAVVLQVRIRELLQQRSQLLFNTFRKGWQVLKQIGGIQTEGTPENLNKTFYIAGGSWYGNDTIWRMVYDLNRILLYTAADGKTILKTPQREYLAILDGIVAGEGNGPLQPLHVDTHAVVVSRNPFLHDMIMARMMGFEYSKIPLLKNYTLFHGEHFVNFEPESTTLSLDGQPIRGVSAIPVLHRFLPSPGWKNHIELDEKVTAG